MHLRRRLAATAVAACAVVACLGAQALPAHAAPVVSRGYEIPEFYNPPATLPAANGALVRSEPMNLALSIPSIGGPLPGTATRLMYKTTDANGQPAAATGAYIEPAASWSGPGPRPLAVVAPGTMGQGDQCTASFGLEHLIVFNGETMSVGYEDIAIYRLLAKGIAVVVADYIGLGTTDRLHTYLDRRDSGHAVLDAARAARSVPGASVTAQSRVSLFGYSQGGRATGSAVELQPTYAPDLNLVGSYVGSPLTDLANIIEEADGTDMTGALGWALSGFLQTHPELRSVADRNLSATGKAVLADLSTMCIGDALLAYGGDPTSGWTTTGGTLAQVIEREPLLRQLMTEENLGTVKPTTPVRVATGTADDLVPHHQGRQLAVDWCDKGANVTYVAVILPSLGEKSLLNHFGPMLTDQGAAVDWIADRLKGQTAWSNCWTMPIQP